MTDKKVCPILPFSTDHVLGHDVHEPRPCLGDRCAWFSDQIGKCGIWDLANSLSCIVLGGVRDAYKPKPPGYEQDDLGTFHV